MIGSEYSMINTDIRSMIVSELKDIYKFIEEDFEYGEYAPYAVLCDQLSSGIQEGFIFYNENSDLAYSICAGSHENGYVLISLLAVFKENRRKGIGSDFIKAIQRRYSNKKAIILEVERPELSKSDEEYRLKSLRMEFYKKLGFYHVSGIDYSIWDVPMHLMALPINSAEEMIDHGIEDIIHQIYLQLMGEQFIYKLQIVKVK